MVISIRLFGPMLVLVGDQPLPRMRSRKALWLLALLSMRADRPVAREWLAGVLWPDVDRATAFANLRPALSDLRRALGEHQGLIRSFDRNRIGLDLTAVDLDIARFDAAMLKEDFATAVELYRGPFLEGCNEEWAPQERSTRETECLRALQTLGERAIEVEDYERALAYFGRAIAIDAWRDAPRRGLMRAFAAKGDVNAALHAYREFAHFLSDRAAVGPGVDTTELYQRLRTRPLRRPHGAKACPLCGTEQHKNPSRTYCFDVYRFTPERQLLLRGNVPIHIGGRALDLLHILVQRAGELVGKEDLIRFCWPDTFVHENNLTVHILALRRALALSTNQPCIVTVPSRGYRFVAPLRVETFFPPTPSRSALQTLEAR